jgi:hypothetical protein
MPGSTVLSTRVWHNEQRQFLTIGCLASDSNRGSELSTQPLLRYAILAVKNKCSKRYSRPWIPVCQRMPILASLPPSG